MHDIQLLKLLREYLDEGSEAYGVAEYCITNISVTKAATAAFHNPSLTNIPIPPESIILMNDYQSMVVNNKFYHTHFNALTSALTMESIRSHSLSKHLLRSSEGHKESEGIVRELQAQRFEVLTLIVLWDKGIEKAKEFDFFFRKAVSLNDQEKRYFEKHGVK